MGIRQGSLIDMDSYQVDNESLIHTPLYNWNRGYMASCTYDRRLELFDDNFEIVHLIGDQYNDNMSYFRWGDYWSEINVNYSVSIEFDYPCYNQHNRWDISHRKDIPIYSLLRFLIWVSF